MKAVNAVNTTMRLVLFVLMLAVGGMIVYNETHSNTIKVRLDFRDNTNPAELLPQLGGTGTRVTEVRQIDPEKNEYEVTFRSRKQKQSLLGWLLGQDWVENAEIEENH